MKIALFTFVFIAGVITTAHARLGDTPDQLAARYGQPLTEIDEKAEGTQIPVSNYVFQKGGFEIKVTVSNGVSAEESYKKLNGDTFTDAEIRTLLGANSQGSEWEAPQPATGGKSWARDDGSTAALNGKTFKVTSKDLIAAQTSAKKTEAQPSLDGF